MVESAVGTVSRKRKRPSVSKVGQVVPGIDAHLQPSTKSSVESRRNVRQLLVDLRSETLAGQDISTKIAALDQKHFPRKDEWTLNYLLGQCQLQMKKQATTDLELIWHHILRLVNVMLPDRLVPILRRSDFILLFQDYLQSGTALKTDDAVEALKALNKLYNSRSLRKVLLTTLEKSYGLLLAVLRQESLGFEVQEDLISISTDILLFCSKHKYTHKKLQGIMQTIGLQEVMRHLGQNPDSPGLRQLLLTTVYSESSLLEATEFEKFVKSLEIGPGIDVLCNVSFEAANLAIKSQTSRLAVRNQLLRCWLTVLPAHQRSTLLKIYRETGLDVKVSRPLSTDKSLTTLLNTCVEEAITHKNPDLSVVIQILDIDLDVILPRYSDKVWSIVKENINSQIAIQWLLAHIEIRAFSEFISRLVVETFVENVSLSPQFMNIIATEVSQASEPVQQTLLDIVLASKSKVKTQVLTSVIGGLTRRSPAMSKHLKTLLSAQKNSADLERLVLLNVAKSQMLEVTASEVSSNFDRKIQNAASAEAWFRSLELDLQTSEVEFSERMSRSLRQCKQSPGLTRAIICRWLPVLAPRMSVEHKTELLDIMFAIVGGDEETSNHCIMAHPNLLESEAFHDTLQQRLLEVSQPRIRYVLKYVPVEFFHKAIRRQLLTRLIALDVYDQAAIQTLLKFARADLSPKFATERDYQAFADSHVPRKGNLLLQSRSNTGEASSSSMTAFVQLKELYSQSLSEDICRSIILNSECELLLRLEMFEELARRQVEDCIDLWDLLTHATLREIQQEEAVINVENGSDVSVSRVPFLVRLLGAIYSNIGPENPNFATIDKLVGEIRDWEQSIAQGIVPRGTNELMAWCCRTASDTLTVCQSILSSIPVRDLYHDSKSLVTAIVKVLPTVQLQELLLLLRQSIVTEEIERSLSLRIIISAVLTEYSASTVDNIDGSWLAVEYLKTCAIATQHSETHNYIQALQVELIFLQSVLIRQSRNLTIKHLDETYAMVVKVAEHVADSVTILALHKLLRCSFEQHAHLLRDRYHLVVYVFQKLLTSIHTKVSAESLVRLFDTFLNSSRSLCTTPEVFNRAFSKHVPWLLIEYISAITNPDAKSSLHGALKTVIEEGLIYEIMGLCSTHEREMVGASLSSSGRGLFKKLYDEWSRFGKWTDQ